MSPLSDPSFPELLAEFRRDPRALAGRVPGIFPVHKPRGCSSHDVVNLARKRLGLRRVGHGGTLDPLADGLLLILAGRATRLFDQLQAFPKTYRATLALGLTTDTLDATGTLTGRDETGRAAMLTQAAVAQALAKYRGVIRQTPPMYSALKRNGQPLYKLARAGETVEREPRAVEVYRLELVGFTEKPAALATDGITDERVMELISQAPTAILEMTVASGFYVRSLIDDLGRDLGAGAVMTALTRTAIGPFDLTTAVSPAAISPPPDLVA